MHNLPQPPQTLITTQLECIRCKHIFPVAEDNPVRRRRRGNETDIQMIIAARYIFRLMFMPRDPILILIWLKMSRVMKVIF